MASARQPRSSHIGSYRRPGKPAASPDPRDQPIGWDDPQGRGANYGPEKVYFECNHVDSRSPIDIVEEVVAHNQWAFSRKESQEIIFEVAANLTTYRLMFHHEPSLDMMVFAASGSLTIPQHRLGPVRNLVLLINEHLWLGHFDLPQHKHTPTFRHGLLLRDGLGIERVEDLIDIALSESERFTPAFHFVTWSHHAPEDALAAALFETAGEA